MATSSVAPAALHTPKPPNRHRSPPNTAPSGSRRSQNTAYTGVSLEETVNSMNETLRAKRERHALWEQHRVLTLRSCRVSREAKVQMYHMRHETDTTSKINKLAEKSEKEFFGVRLLQIESAERTRALHALNVQERETFAQRKTSDVDGRGEVEASLRDATTYLIGSRDQKNSTSPRASRPPHSDVKITPERLEQLCTWEERLPPISAARQQRDEHAAAHREQLRIAAKDRAVDRAARREEQQRHLEDVSMTQERRHQAIQSQHLMDGARVEHLAWKKRHPLRAEAIERLEKMDDDSDPLAAGGPKAPSPKPPPKGQAQASSPSQTLRDDQAAAQWVADERAAVEASESAGREQVLQHERASLAKKAKLAETETDSIAQQQRRANAAAADTLVDNESAERGKTETAEREKRGKLNKLEDSGARELKNKAREQERAAEQDLERIEDFMKAEAAARDKLETDQQIKRTKKERAEYLAEKQEKQAAKKAEVEIRKLEEEEREARGPIEEAEEQETKVARLAQEAEAALAQQHEQRRQQAEAVPPVASEPEGDAAAAAPAEAAAMDEEEFIAAEGPAEDTAGAADDEAVAETAPREGEAPVSVSELMEQ